MGNINHTPGRPMPRSRCSIQQELDVILVDFLFGIFCLIGVLFILIFIFVGFVCVCVSCFVFVSCFL